MKEYKNIHVEDGYQYQVIQDMFEDKMFHIIEHKRLENGLYKLVNTRVVFGFNGKDALGRYKRIVRRK